MTYSLTFSTIIMHFSSFLFPLAILASFVAATPLEQPKNLEERGVSASASGSPSFKAGEASVHASTNVQFEKAGVTAEAGVSKRSDYNELTKRTTPYGTLIVCSGYNCSGNCYSYGLPVSAYTCYGVATFNSAYVAASSGLTYGVFVGPNCNSTSIPPFSSIDQVSQNAYQYF